MFKFKLEKLLKIRQKEEDDLANLYILKLHEVEKEKYQLSNIIDEQNRIKSQKLTRNLIAIDLVQLDNYLKTLKEKEEKQKLKIENLKKEAENIKEQLLEARKKKKILETLKEKQYQKYLHEQKLIEQKIIDEIGVIRHIKK